MVKKNFTDRQGADIMTIQECYTKLKGNYEDAVRRLSSDNLIERFMLMFPKDTTMQALRAAVAEGNIEESFRAAHTLKGLMREVCNDGGAIFFSTHVLEVAEKLCDKVAIIKGGRLIRSGTMDEVKGDESLESVFLELEAE